MHWNTNVGAVVFAAGRGTRMQADQSKVLLPLNGRPVIHYIIETLQSLPFTQIVVVTGYQASAVRASVEAVADARIRFVTQEKLLGTGHALSVAYEALAPDSEHVLVVNGDDSAFYRSPTLARLLSQHLTEGNVCTMLFARREPDIPFGRVHVDPSGKVQFLAYDTMQERGLQLDLVSTGAYVFDSFWLRDNLHAIPRYANGEYPIFELVYAAQRQERNVGHVVLEKPFEWMSINTPEELKQAEQQMRRRAARTSH